MGFDPENYMRYVGKEAASSVILPEGKNKFDTLPQNFTEVICYGVHLTWYKMCLMC